MNFNMTIGIVCEGVTDRAVIENILYGLKGISDDDIIAILPSDSTDETDKALTFSSSSVVLKNCQEGELFETFFMLHDEARMIIHLDTAESDELGIVRPDKASKEYCIDLRNNFIEALLVGLAEIDREKLIFAIAIEEIEAWVHTIYEQVDTSSTTKAKEKLYALLRKNGHKPKQTYKYFQACSDDFSKNRNFRKVKYRNFNCSLDLFCSEVENKIPDPV